MKKFKIVIAGISFLILVFALFCNSKIDRDFTIVTVYYGESDIDPTLVDEKEYFIKNMKDLYNMPRKEAERLYSKPSDYVEIGISYTIENHSPLPMYVIKCAFPNSGCYICTLAQECTAHAFIAPNSSSSYGTTVYVKRENLTKDFLHKFKFYVLSLGTYPVMSVSFSDYENITDIQTLDESEFTMWPDDLAEELYYYQPVNSSNAKYNITNYNQHSSHYSRLSPDCVYTVSKFIYNGQDYCGFAFFDKNGVFQSGMAIHKLWDDKTAFHFTVGKSTFADVNNIDKGCILFDYNGEKKSYHYFSDGTCIEIVYTDDEVVSKINSVSVKDMFDKLIDDDAAFITK